MTFGTSQLLGRFRQEAPAGFLVSKLDIIAHSHAF
jgi:hypothetical protein